MEEKEAMLKLLSFTTHVTAAHISAHPVEVSEISDIMQRIHTTVRTLAGVSLVGPTIAPDPVVPVADSVYPDYLICLEDGKKLKMLKRHLRTVYHLSPQQYRDRWGLPNSYPMVAPNYAERRSSIAKSIGLGTSRKKERRG
jgi:predicted transcriptional regulator